MTFWPHLKLWWYERTWDISLGVNAHSISKREKMILTRKKYCSIRVTEKKVLTPLFCARTFWDRQKERDESEIIREKIMFIKKIANREKVREERMELKPTGMWCFFLTLDFQMSFSLCMPRLFMLFVIAFFLYHRSILKFRIFCIEHSTY